MFLLKNCKNCPAAGASAPRPPSAVTNYLVTMPICDTLELHQFVRHRAKSGSFCVKKNNFWFTPVSKILVARVVALTAVDRFFKRLWAADEMSSEMLPS